MNEKITPIDAAAKRALGALMPVRDEVGEQDRRGGVAEVVEADPLEPACFTTRR